MIREAIEELGPPGALPSEEAVTLLYGPEPIHEAQAIVDALANILEGQGRREAQHETRRTGEEPTRPTS